MMQMLQVFYMFGYGFVQYMDHVMCISYVQLCCELMAWM